MGVHGLMAACLKRQDECTEAVDLVEIARQKEGIELLVDFNCFKHHLIYKFWTGLSAVRNNPYIKILGGEYSSMERYVTRLIEDLQSLKIQLVFFTDGAKGSSTEAFLQKKDTWIQRDKEDIEKIREILDKCGGQGQSGINDVDNEKCILPLLLEDQFMAAAKNCGCKFIQNPAGEADLMLIRNLKAKAYAILSNDADFFIFLKSCFIPFKLFDIDNNLQLGQPSELPGNPLSLKVKVIRTEKVMSMLQLKHHTDLVDMAILSGNEYTRQFMREFFQGKEKAQFIASWISKNETSHQFLSEKMRKNKKFKDAVEYSRKFYSQSEVDAPPQICNFSKIADGIESGKYPTIFMSIHNGYYWHKMLLEDIPNEQSYSEQALRPLRKYIYRIVLPPEKNQVEEYSGRISLPENKEVVQAVEDQTVPSIDEIMEDDQEENLRHFHKIMSHQVGDAEQDTGYWFDHYERKAGFTIYLLRYFLLQNWRHNLRLLENECQALVAMAFSEANEAEYQRVVIKPTVRCVTIGSWFQNLYRHASMLASVLSIKDEFPLPSEIFCGSRWTAMYMVCTDQADRNTHGRVKGWVDSIIEEKRDMICHIVKGISPRLDL